VGGKKGGVRGGRGGMSKGRHDSWADKFKEGWSESLSEKPKVGKKKKGSTPYELVFRRKANHNADASLFNTCRGLREAPSPL